MTVADDADDIEHLRRYLGLARIDLLGHSASGATGIDFAERYPKNLSRLILVEAVALDENKTSKEEDADSQRIQENLSADPRYASAIRHMKTFSPPLDDVAMLKELQDTAAFYFADPQKNMPKFARSSEGMKPSAWAERHFGEAGQARPWHQESLLGQVRAETLVVNGEQDWVVPKLVAEHLHAGIAGSKIAIIDGSGHFPWIEQPVAFFSAVERFLDAPRRSTAK